jgi:hypothetical protein
MDVKARLKSASEKAAASLNPDKAAGDMDILDKLKQEHDEVEEMLTELVESEGAAQRRALLGRIKAALMPHLKAEEKVVYDAVIAIKGEKNRVDGAEGYMEHDIAQKTLLKLDKMTKLTAPEFTAGAKVLKDLVQHHVKEEESNIWSDIKDNFDYQARVEMNRRFEAAKKKVNIP